MKLDIIGFGSIGSALVRLIIAYMPDIRIRIFDIQAPLGKEFAYFTNVEMVCNANYDAVNFNETIICCASWPVTRDVAKILLLKNNNLENHKTLISICRPDDGDVEVLAQTLWKDKIKLILACGLEPGLTEILSYYLLHKVDVAYNLNIQCGGIVIPRPKNLLGYKRLFGTSYLPFATKNCFCIHNGRLITVPRFSDIKLYNEPDIGEFETWHDGMQKRLNKHPKLNHSNVCVDQRTIRYPGYADTVNLLQKAGILNELPIYNYNKYSAKSLFETLAYDSFSFNPQNEKSITLLNFNLDGLQNGHKTNIKLQIKFPDLTQHINSMALATCLPTLFLLLNKKSMLSKNTLQGIIYPENIFTQEYIGDLFKYMQTFGIVISESNNKI